MCVGIDDDVRFIEYIIIIDYACIERVERGRTLATARKLNEHILSCVCYPLILPNPLLNYF